MSAGEVQVLPTPETIGEALPDEGAARHRLSVESTQSRLPLGCPRPPQPVRSTATTLLGPRASIVHEHPDARIPIDEEAAA